MVMTAKQLANLRPAKKGEIRNPTGGNQPSVLLKALRKITIDSYREVIEFVMSNNITALKAIIEDKEAPAFKVGVATSMLKAIKTGDYNMIDRIAERIIGKIPDNLNVNMNYHTSLLKWLDDRKAGKKDEFED